MADEQYGFEAGGAFAPAYQAAQRRLQGQFARQKGELAQSLAARGVRSSGVSDIPEQNLERNQSEAEAGLIGNFAQNQAEQALTDARIKEQQDFERQMEELGFGQQSGLQAAIGRRQLQGQLLAGGIGAAGAALTPAPTYIL